MHSRPSKPRIPAIRFALIGLAAGSLAAVSLCAGAVLPADAQGASDPKPRHVEDDQRAAYLEDRWQRLSTHADRDRLLAAELIGWQMAATPTQAAAQARLRRRLADRFKDDPLARFVLALGCQARPGCTGHADYDALVRLAPDNAIHWLVLPQAGPPDAAQLHSAASASVADSHLPELMRMVRDALEPSPTPAASADPAAAALAIRWRRESVDAIPLPLFSGVVPLCRAPSAAQRDDCIALGRKLLTDRSGAILPRMVGSAMVRRLRKGTPEAAEAMERRRDYVWLSGKLPDAERADDATQRDAAAFGEWDAWLRLADRLGVPRQPPVGWEPADPRLMQLWEDRAPAGN